MSHFCDPTHRIDRDVISPICQRSLLDRFRIDCVYREFTLGDYFQGMLFVSIFIVAFPREAPSHSHRGTIFLPTRDNLADRAPTGRQTDRQKRIRTNARGGTQEDAHGKIAGKFSKREVSALFARTAFSALVRRWAERARGRGGGVREGHMRGYYTYTRVRSASCREARANAPSSASLCPKGHSSASGVFHIYVSKVGALCSLY
jgi:hypothetical protein